jgi:hypothetical protein
MKSYAGVGCAGGCCLFMVLGVGAVAPGKISRLITLLREAVGNLDASGSGDFAILFRFAVSATDGKAPRLLTIDRCGRVYCCLFQSRHTTNADFISPSHDAAVQVQLRLV